MKIIVKIKHKIIKYLPFLTFPERKLELSKIYNKWLIANKPLHTKYYNILGIVLLALLIPFDFLLFEQGLIYTRTRILVIAIILLNLLFFDKFSWKIQFAKKDRFSVSLFLPGIIWNLIYTFYLYSTTGEDYTIVLLANFLVVIISTLFLYRYWREQYTINIVSIFLLMIVSYLKPEISHDCFLLSFFHGVSFVTAYFYRRKFIQSVFEKYNLTSSLVPRKIASIIAISDSDLSIEGLFDVKERFTVCLCSDWRDYQTLASKYDPKYIGRLFEHFYDIVFEELDLNVPDGNYYADWTADELFIIFYSETDDKKETLHNALRFAQSLASKVYDRVVSEIEVELKYDIGLACGMGLLGLQGPKKLKKTTITSETAGTAKRLETEAKYIRNQTSDCSNYPILVMDNNLKESTREIEIFSNGDYQEITAKTKDIKDNLFYLWQYKCN